MQSCIQFITLLLLLSWFQYDFHISCMGLSIVTVADKYLSVTSATHIIKFVKQLNS